MRRKSIIFFIVSLMVLHSPIFAATAPSTKLKVPYFKQQFPNSCEAASLRMALAYYGIKKNDIQIVLKFGYDPRPKDWDKNIWDDPQKQYVGHVDVSGRPNGGYGTYGLPVVKAIELFGRRAEYATGTAITSEWLARQIAAKNPVVIWGATSFTEPPYTWTTPEGKEIKAFKGEHARLLVGFKGTVKNPIGFYVHDPYTNESYKYWPAVDLIKHMNLVPGVTDQAVVVR